ncbi:single-stranded DNA-binding protein [Nocardia sp. NBC_01009]|uniref:single-stranded DNA-binding protein n=1 Tax=Nocardia sp. NBC_01009 TaxID=2975996 RepID=UPI003865D723|nr:single-stranded DNA-binding protein [Nocardia sp. NBC_01009]
MAGDTTITVIGNITADPELAVTPSGVAVTNFTVASTPRYFDRNANEWKDGEALFMRCNVWREAAEHVVESLTRGARVSVTGRLKQRSYQTAEGEKRTVVELEADEVAASLRYATAKITKASPRGGWNTETPKNSRAISDDPWASSTPRESAFAGVGADTEPGF